MPLVGYVYMTIIFLLNSVAKWKDPEVFPGFFKLYAQ